MPLHLVCLLVTKRSTQRPKWKNHAEHSAERLGRKFGVFLDYKHLPAPSKDLGTCMGTRRYTPRYLGTWVPECIPCFWFGSRRPLVRRTEHGSGPRPWCSRLHGEGEFMSNSGARYVGQWFEGQKHGQGQSFCQLLRIFLEGSMGSGSCQWGGQIHGASPVPMTEADFGAVCSIERHLEGGNSCEYLLKHIYI